MLIIPWSFLSLNFPTLSRKSSAIFFIIFLIGCQRVASPLTLSHGLGSTVITTSSHQHWLVKNKIDNTNKNLHVYIEGDGTPWTTPYQIAKDPTPANALMLKLMKQDSHQSWYLGRPCYFNHINFGLSDLHCTPRLWTSARYSNEVVESMVNALRQALAIEKHFSKISLIGHSGGGTLATLMAMRMPEVTQLVTIAANLDIDAWTTHHHFSPLFESLNPAQLLQLSFNIKQLHFAGEMDDQVPLEPVKKILENINQKITIIPAQNHRDWNDIWPSLLTAIDAQDDLP